jgi:hypothetical protein
MSSTEPVVQKSRFEDILDVFFAPTELFERRRNDSFWPPLFILILLSTAFYYILLPAQGMILRSALKPEQLAKAAPMMKWVAVGAGVAVPFAIAISVAITAGVLWLIARLVDAKPDFQQMMIVATYAAYVTVLAQIGKGVAAMIHGEEGLQVMKHLSFGVLRFVDVNSVPKVLAALLIRVDIFTIWQAVLWAIGFRIATGVSKQKAALVAGATWFLFAVPGMIGSGVASKMGTVNITTAD